MSLFSQTTGSHTTRIPPRPEDFIQSILAASAQKLIIVDFWAPWCGPCKKLSPILEKAVAAAGQKVELVKINIEQNPHTAAQLRIRSIPAVLAFFAGKPVDGFVGALPESQVAAFIKRAIERAGPDLDSGTPNPADADGLNAATRALNSGDIPKALELYGHILAADPQSAAAAAGIARCYLSRGDIAQAKGILENLGKDAGKDACVQGALAALALAQRGQEAISERSALDERLRHDPKNHAIRLRRALVRFAVNDPKGAIEDLLGNHSPRAELE